MSEQRIHARGVLAALPLATTQGRVGMKRLTEYVVVAITLAVACQATAQSMSQRTLADRLSSLRKGWSFSSDEGGKAPAQMTTPERVAKRTVAEPAPRSTAVASDTSRPFPRVSPRELMPRSWFSVGVKEQPRTQPAPVRTAMVSDGSVGSARSRLLRDLRRQNAVSDAPLAASTATPRAGSVLSPNASAATPSQSTQDKVDARLARSIAAEVAGVMADEAPAEPQDSFEEPAAAEEEMFAVEPAVESLLPFGPIEGTTPTDEQPVAEVVHDVTPDFETTPEAMQEEPTVAETDSGRISVAARPSKTTKLPMFIGGRYSAYADEEGSTVEPTEAIDAEEAADSSAAAGAFAAGPNSTTRRVTVEAEPAVEQEEDLLFTQRMPVLVSKVSGPRTIVLGREVTYRVLLANRGEVGADRVVTTVTVPAWADVVGTEAALGEVDHTVNADGKIIWHTGRLNAGEIVKLDLRLIARSGQAIELGVAHTHQPIDGSTLVNVQEPKLSLDLVGPEEVLFGKPQVFRLTIANPGTGAAENVVLHLTPPGGDLEKQTSHEFGLIAAGEERTVEIELTAREAGQLAVNASAEADGDVAAATTKEVFCRKPELVVDWRGPSDRFSGAPAVYYLRVRNPGTATAENVVMTAELPKGFVILPTDDVQQTDGLKLTFRAGDLRPGDDKFFELRGTLQQAGSNAIKLQAADSGETRSERVTALTEVVALADLKLDVLDPTGPVATSQEVAYEIRVTNRGSSDARDVRVLGLFSEGIEPHHVDGAAYDIRDGRVAFEKIDRIAAGEVRTFTIHARAHEEGMHQFRAEVLCRDLEIKLAADETTRFFEDAPIDVAADGYPSGSTNSLYPR